MLPPSIVVELAERVRACRTQLDDAEAATDKLRLDYNGYLTLLTFAESQTEVPVVAPAWDARAEEDCDPAARCWCGMPDQAFTAHGTALCVREVPEQQPPAGALLASDSTRGPGWCFCGLPGIPGMVHGSISCTEGQPHATPALPEIPVPASRERFPFQPFTPVAGSDVVA